MVSKYQDKFIFNINNYIYCDQFNQLYDLDKIENNIRNKEVIAYKLGLALIRITKDRLNTAREERQR